MLKKFYVTWFLIFVLGHAWADVCEVASSQPIQMQDDGLFPEALNVYLSDSCAWKVKIAAVRTFNVRINSSLDGMMVFKGTLTISKNVRNEDTAINRKIAHRIENGSYQSSENGFDLYFEESEFPLIYIDNLSPVPALIHCSKNYFCDYKSIHRGSSTNYRLLGQFTDIFDPQLVKQEIDNFMNSIFKLK